MANPADLRSPATAAPFGAKTLAKRVVFGFLRRSGAAALVRRVGRKRVTIVAYHDPSPEVLESQLNTLSRLYSFVSLGDYLDAVERGSMRHLPLKPLVLTLDDGWRGNAALVPVLKRFGIRPTIFVCTSIVGTHRHFWWTECDSADRQRLKRVSNSERQAELRATGFEETREYSARQALSLEELHMLERHVDFQLHTRFHPVLPMCTDGEARDEILLGAEEFERLLGRRPKVLAYPNGDLTQREARLAEEAGILWAVTCESGSNSVHTPAHELKRVVLTDAAVDRDELVVCVAGIYGWMRAAGLVRGGV